MNIIKIHQIIRSNRRTLALEITPNASLIVRAPKRCSLSYINGFVKKKTRWIEKNHALIQKRCANVRNKKFVTGEEFLHLGRSYYLKISDQHKDISIANWLYFPQSMLIKAKASLISWYKNEALKHITFRVNKFSVLTGLTYKSIKITSAQKRWGSCSAKGGLCFSWRLIMAPLEVLDYVVVHELVHLKERNHSANFWDKVREILPNYVEEYKWLKENGSNLTI